MVVDEVVEKKSRQESLSDQWRAYDYDCHYFLSHMDPVFHQDLAHSSDKKQVARKLLGWK